AKHRLPTCGFPEFAAAGGLMAYGINLPEMDRRRGLRRQDSQGCEAGGPSSRARDEVHDDRQSQDRPGDGHRHAHIDSAARRRGDRMKRRQFIALVGGAAVAWPLAARAQQRDQVRRIGVLAPAAANDPVWQARVGAFPQALALLGWIIARNVRIDPRWATPDAATIRREAEELAALAPDVILAAGHSSAAPLLQATRTLPFVFVMVQDAVAAGFVDSLAR